MLNQLFYKITDYLEIPVHHLIQYITNNTRGSSANAIRRITTRIDRYKFSFLPQTIKMWNTIPTAVRASASLDSFQNAMRTLGVCGITPTPLRASFLTFKILSCKYTSQNF
jgi:hypothetical protein